jgi:hypothetical protein
MTKPTQSEIQVIFLTNGSKQFWLDRAEVFDPPLKDRFVLCSSKLVGGSITWKLSSVLFLQRLTL